MAPGAVGIRGAGLIEALIALGLLAGTTLGTLAAFTGAERGGHAAWLRLTAVDLAAEAAEQLRAVQVAANWDAAPWLASAAARLPGARVSATADDGGYLLSLDWMERASGTPRTLRRHVDLEAAP